MPEKLCRAPLVTLSQDIIPKHNLNQVVGGYERESRPKSAAVAEARERPRVKSGRASQASVIVDGLFLAGARAVRPTRLRELGVTLVINATAELPPPPLDNVQVMVVRLTDAPTTDLAAHLDDVADRIQVELSSGGRVLVHCVAGVSRSPALVLAYLIKHTAMSLRQAFMHVRAVRPAVRPNAGFFSQLIEFERRVRGSSSVALVLDSRFGLTIPDVCHEELQVLRDARWAAVIRDRLNFSRVYA